MVVDFIEKYAKLIASKPEKVSANSEMIADNFMQITISVSPVDIGKIIGKNGNMINALKTLVNGCKAKDGISYKIQVVEN